MSDRPDLLDVLEDINLDELDAYTLADYALKVRTLAERAGRMDREITARIHRAMTEHYPDSGQWVLADVLVEKERQFGNYEWDTSALMALFKGRVLPAQMAEMVKVEEIPAHQKVSVVTAAVKKYAKKIGLSEEELATAYQRPENQPKYKYTEIPDLIPAMEASIEAIKEKANAK